MVSSTGSGTEEQSQEELSLEELFPGVYLLEVEGHKRIATLPKEASAVYGEPIIGGYRLWDPNRSKLAALILKEHRGSGRTLLEGLGLRPGIRVLYLGAATGTTVSHVSDVVGNGTVYAVEFSPRAMRDLVRLCMARKNIVPLLEDANRPESYSAVVEPVDLIYQDVAQRRQADIAAKNAAMYLKPGGTLLLMIKSRSVDVTLPPEEVYRAEVGRLEGLEVVGEVDLRPYHLDHLAVMARKPGPS